MSIVSSLATLSHRLTPLPSFIKVLFRGLIGGAMLCYGVHFSHLVVFAHTIRVTGWPFIERTWNEAIDMYVKARQTIKVRKDLDLYVCLSLCPSGLFGVRTLHD